MLRANLKRRGKMGDGRGKKKPQGVRREGARAKLIGKREATAPFGEEEIRQ